MNILALTKYSYAVPNSRYQFYNYKECFTENKVIVDRVLDYRNRENDFERLFSEFFDTYLAVQRYNEVYEMLL